MTLTLCRNEFTKDGVFGELIDDDGEVIAVTLEHGYETDLAPFDPKVPPGEYTCQRGMHQLEHIPEAFSTFELLDVPGHDHILIHPGNRQSDSEGCILVGTEITILAGERVITGSKLAFNRMMALLNGINEFQLVVE